MINGEKLFDILAVHMEANGLYWPKKDVVTAPFRRAITNATIEINVLFKTHQENGVRESMLLSWLSYYGRHRTSCTTGLPCQCGFEQVEKEALGR